MRFTKHQVNVVAEKIIKDLAEQDNLNITQVELLCKFHLELWKRLCDIEEKGRKK